MILSKQASFSDIGSNSESFQHTCGTFWCKSTANMPDLVASICLCILLFDTLKLLWWWNIFSVRLGYSCKFYKDQFTCSLQATVFQWEIPDLFVLCTYNKMHMSGDSKLSCMWPHHRLRKKDGCLFLPMYKTGWSGRSKYLGNGCIHVQPL